jgi:hypothetical protein
MVERFQASQRMIVITCELATGENRRERTVIGCSNANPLYLAALAIAP